MRQRRNSDRRRAYATNPPPPDQRIAELYRQLASGDGAAREQLLMELGRRGRLWATPVSGYHQTVQIRLHDEGAQARGAKRKTIMEIGTYRGHNLDLKGMGPRGNLRLLLLELRARYGARSRALELRESDEAQMVGIAESIADGDVQQVMPPGGMWASMYRERAKRKKKEGVVGWNPPPFVFANWHVGGFKEEESYVLYALTPEGHRELLTGVLDFPTDSMVLGQLRYSVIKSKRRPGGHVVYVDAIWVKPPFRRQGLGTLLWGELIRLWPNATFPPGVLTEAGAALRKSVGKNPPVPRNPFPWTPGDLCPSCGEEYFARVFEAWGREWQLETCCPFSHEVTVDYMRGWTNAEWKSFMEENLHARRALPQHDWQIDYGITVTRLPTKKDVRAGRAPAGALTWSEGIKLGLSWHRHLTKVPRATKIAYAIWNGRPGPLDNLIGIATVGGTPSPMAGTRYVPHTSIRAGDEYRELVRGQRYQTATGKLGGQPRQVQLRVERIADVTMLALAHHQVPAELTWKASSALYRQAAEDARASGHTMVVTYVLESESGMSLRYARWKKLATGRGGGQWGSESRPRAAREGEVAGSKDLFGKRLAPPLVTDAELSRRSNEGPSQLDLFALSNPGDDLDFYLSVLRWLDGKGPRPNLEAWEPRKDEPGWAHEAFRKIALERKKKRLIAALQGKRAAHFKDKSGVSYMIHPAVRPDAPAGYWQLTTFALDGAPWGHRYVSSLAEGVSELVDEIGSVELHESNPPCHSPKRASKALKGVVDSGSRQCYPASEAFYHAVCGQARGFTPVQGKHEGMSHWWVRGPKGKVYDLTARQFQTPVPYDQGRGRGWLTKKPSKRAVALMRKAGLV